MMSPEPVKTGGGGGREHVQRTRAAWQQGVGEISRLATDKGLGCLVRAANGGVCGVCRLGRKRADEHLSASLHKEAVELQ